MKEETLKIGRKVWIVESELGGTEFIRCEIITSHLGTKDDDDDEPYPDEDYDLKELKTGVIWDFVNREDIYLTKQDAIDDY